MDDRHPRSEGADPVQRRIEYDIYDVFNNKSATDVMRDARDAVAAAQRANVAIYAVDPRGLTQLGDESIQIPSFPNNPQMREGSPLAFQRELLLAQESLIALAEETGGITECDLATAGHCRDQDDRCSKIKDPSLTAALTGMTMSVWRR